MKYHVLYNPLAGNGRCEGRLGELLPRLDGECILYKMTEIDDYRAEIEKRAADGWRYVGCIPTKQRGTGHTEEMDLIFEKEV